MRYYQPEHGATYREIKERGHTQWNDLFVMEQSWTYDNFQNRSFLEHILPTLELPRPADTRVFEYGCGTGPAACFLAGLGYSVDAVDLIPDAISIAREMAEQRGVGVNWGIADICAHSDELPTGPFTLVLDSFCLQSIVTDEDRSAVYSSVRSLLAPDGYYLITTAMKVPGRKHGPGYNFDEDSAILYREVPSITGIDEASQFNGRFYLPHRRHLTADQLFAELMTAGFDVISLESTESANVVCRLT